MKRSDKVEKDKIEQMFTVREVAELLKVGDETIWRWIKSGRLKAIKLAKEYRIPESALKSLLYGETEK